MHKSLKWKILLLIAVVFYCGMTVLPSFNKNLPDWWKKYLAPEGIRLGLDLQGGMHLVLKVDLDKAMENTLDFSAQNLKDLLADKQISLVRTPSTDPHRVIMTLPNSDALETVRKIIKDDFGEELEADIKAETGSFPRIVLRLSDKKISYIKTKAVDQSLEIIRNRIDQFGVAEPVIVRQGTDEIIVQLPGVKDPDRAMGLIGQTAQLEFKLVDDTSGVDVERLINQAVDSGQWKPGEGRKKLNLALQSQLPQGSEIYFEKMVDKETRIERQIPILMKSPVLMTGEMVKDAQVQYGGTFNEPYVSLELTSLGGKVFGQLTEKNVKKRLAIVLDEVVRSAPRIQERILGGRAQITGSFSFEEATDLAIVLRVGALPAPVNVVQNLTVGASLGQDSINKGLMSGLVGTVLVIVFMIAYYNLSGLVANMALFLNILLLMAGLAVMNATLTMPGIAGIVLTIGMAVDSNVIIYERMREEFAIGKSLKSGIDAGFDKALWTIVDAHVTTLITALALFLFGTGPIKGFAVTLSLGIVFNLFTTLYGTRIIYDILYGKKWLKTLTFREFLKRPNIDFMGLKKFAYGFSAVMCILGLLAIVQIGRGKANMGVDFTGGTLLEYRANSPFNLVEVRKSFADQGLQDLELQQVVNENRLIVKLKKSEEVIGNLTEKVTKALNATFSDKQFTLDNQAEIGSSVSASLRGKALLSIAISMLGVILYLAFRFDARFGLAAAAATFHDVLAVLGLCWILNVEITLLIVTALLTLAGYSLNDTVVIFDRIRENTRKAGGDENLPVIINTSVNDVFTRTIVLSITVFVTVLSLYLLGGSVIHDFSFAMLAGVIVGTYSSIFVASPMLMLWRPGKAAA